MNGINTKSLLTHSVKSGLTIITLVTIFAAPLQAHSDHEKDTVVANTKDSHAQHKAMLAENKLDHSAHKGHSMAEKSEDPHAQHKAMIADSASAKDTVKRSTHDYNAPRLTMLNQNNETVAIQQLLRSNKPIMVNFIFTTCPTICPVLSSTFSVVNRELAGAKNLTMISISIDPEADTPTALQQYAKKFEARENWTFVTGTIEDSIQLQKAFDIYRGSKMNHEPVTYLRANANKPWTRLDGFPSSEQLISEYHHMNMGH